MCLVTGLRDVGIVKVGVVVRVHGPLRRSPSRPAGWQPSRKAYRMMHVKAISSAADNERARASIG
jgi:hypothetical protein